MSRVVLRAQNDDDYGRQWMRQIAGASMSAMAAVPGSTRDADRAGVLVAAGSEVVLIERHRDGLHYWVAPGGGVEHGETPDVAAAREALEELGLEVVIERKVLELRGLHPRGRVQHYFLASAAERGFQRMTGPESVTSSNTYTPRWVHLRDVARCSSESSSPLSQRRVGQTS